MTGVRKPLQGLTTALKERLIQDSLQRRLRRTQQDPGESAAPAEASPAARSREDSVPDSWCRFDLHPGYQQLRILNEGAAKFGVSNPYFRAHDGVAGASTVIGGETFVNYSSYNYLGLAGHPTVHGAAKDAIDRYGTSASASRLVSGERPIHRELERELADLHGVDDCVVFVSGHATNVSTIGHLFGPKDLVVHDALIHNSVLMGIQLSGARRMLFAHNDWDALDRLLAQCRLQYERVLISSRAFTAWMAISRICPDSSRSNAATGRSSWSMRRTRWAFWAIAVLESRSTLACAATTSISGWARSARLWRAAAAISPARRR
jgi:8-amino-7-oxononanoate synthase